MKTTKVIALETLKNAYDQVLFVEGETYTIINTTSTSLFILNELRTETYMTKSRASKYFVFA